VKAHLGSTLEGGWPMLQGIVFYSVYETYSLLGWSVERSNINSRCYSMKVTMYVYTSSSSLLNSMQRLQSHK